MTAGVTPIASSADDPHIAASGIPRYLRRFVEPRNDSFAGVDQEYLLTSLVAHLDNLDATLRGALLLAIAFWWAGIERTAEIQAFGMSISQAWALVVAVVFYLVANLFVLDRLLRIGDLLCLASDANLMRAVSRTALHPWVMNPFAYFGTGVVARTHTAKGYGLLIVAWWLCNASLYGLSRQVLSAGVVLLQVCFMIIGLASIWAIGRVFLIALSRTKDTHAEVHQQILRTVRERRIAVGVSVILGALLAAATQVLTLRL
jgi:uncharacterized membrane protein YuzA (DUF378 family)